MQVCVYLWKYLAEFFFIMKNVWAKRCRENEIAHLCSLIYFENFAVCERMWKDIVELDRPQMTI